MSHTLSVVLNNVPSPSVAPFVYHTIQAKRSGEGSSFKLLAPRALSAILNNVLSPAVGVAQNVACASSESLEGFSVHHKGQAECSGEVVQNDLRVLHESSSEVFAPREESPEELFVHHQNHAVRLGEKVSVHASHLTNSGEYNVSANSEREGVSEPTGMQILRGQRSVGQRKAYKGAPRGGRGKRLSWVAAEEVRRDV